MTVNYNDIQGWDLTRRIATDVPEAPRPDVEWVFDDGRAWVFYGAGHRELRKPFIVSDDFHDGSSQLDVLFDALENQEYAFLSELRRRGQDVILVGYNDCASSLLGNAKVARMCIFKAITERLGNAPLTVGGIGAGGLIMRFTLARMEQDSIDHQTALYFSYDTPHLGAWIPPSLQALALALPASSTAYQMITSDAARELLWRRLPEVGGTPGEDPRRTQLVAALKAAGGWPARPRKIGVANGKGSGTNGIRSGNLAVRSDAPSFALYTQAAGSDQRVAEIAIAGMVEQRTSGLPEADGAHGGTLEGFAFAGEALGGVCDVASHCFVPTASAIAAGATDPWKTLAASVGSARSELDELKCAGDDQAHGLMTQELGSWILDRLPRD